MSKKNIGAHRYVGCMSKTNSNIELPKDARKIVEEYKKLVEKYLNFKSPVDETGAVRAASKRFLIIHTDAFPKTGKELEATLYLNGYNLGRRAAKRLIARFNDMGLPKIEALKLLLAACTCAGFGIFTLGKIEGEEVTIRVYNSAEYDSYMRVYKKHPGRPVCKMIAGILAGAWSEYVGKPCRALEVKCLGKGDKYCEFIVEPII